MQSINQHCDLQILSCNDGLIKHRRLQLLVDLQRFPKTKDKKRNGPLIDVVHARQCRQAYGILLYCRAHGVLMSRVHSTAHWYAMAYCMVSALLVLRTGCLILVLRAQSVINGTSLDRDWLYSSLEQNHWYAIVEFSSYLAFEGLAAYHASLQLRGCIVLENIRVHRGASSDSLRKNILHFHT